MCKIQVAKFDSMCEIQVCNTNDCTEPNQTIGPGTGSSRSIWLKLMTYFDLVSSHIEKNGGSPELIAAVRDYLENAHPHQEPPWSQEYDEICQKGPSHSPTQKLSAYAAQACCQNRQPSNGRHRQSLAQERHAIRQALRQPNSVSAHRSMLKRLEELEKLITDSNKRRTK